MVAHECACRIGSKRLALQIKATEEGLPG